MIYHREDLLQAKTAGCDDLIVFEKKGNDPGIFQYGKAGGISHFGFRLLNAEDIREIDERIKDPGGKIAGKGEFVPGEPYLFFKDPDGY